MVIAFELYYLGFGLAIASLSPNELLASLLVPVFFTFAVAFCGVVVPYPALPTFWRSWMYHLTPFKYLVEAMLGLVVHAVPVKCSDDELAIFSPPTNTTCAAYVKPYVAQAGGYVQKMPNNMCGFCRYANGDEFVSFPLTFLPLIISIITVSLVFLLFLLLRTAANKYSYRPRDSTYTTKTSGWTTAFSLGTFCSISRSSFSARGCTSRAGRASRAR
jgi:ABC-type multidrug transport system permease subunit